MEELLKKRLIKKNPEMYDSLYRKDETVDGKSSFASTTDACKTDAGVKKKKRQKKKRMTITFDVLKQVHDLLRKY